VSVARFAWSIVLLLGCTPIAPLDYDAGREPQLDAGPGDRDAGTDAGCHPALLDLCDGADDDCDPSSADGSEDPSVGAPCDGPDADLCAEGVYSCASGGLVCDDATADTVETCDAAMADEDCDGAIDEDGAIGALPFYPDADGDNYGDDAGLRMMCRAPIAEPWTMRAGDCDDGDPQVRPGLAERCNASDDDCDGTIDEGAPCGRCTPRSSGGRAYLFCEDEQTWNDARVACQTRGYDLVVIEDAAENDFVFSQARDLGIGSFQGWWIGLSDAATEGEYVWVDGTVATYFHWASGEPDGVDDCVRQMAPLSLARAWADIACGQRAGFVCEAP